MPGIDIYNLAPEAYGAVIGEPSGHNIPAIRNFMETNCIVTFDTVAEFVVFFNRYLICCTHD